MHAFLEIVFYFCVETRDKFECGDRVSFGLRNVDVVPFIVNLIRAEFIELPYGFFVNELVFSGLSKSQFLLGHSQNFATDQMVPFRIQLHRLLLLQFSQDVGVVDHCEISLLLASNYVNYFSVSFLWGHCQ